MRQQAPKTQTPRKKSTKGSVEKPKIGTKSRTGANNKGSTKKTARQTKNQGADPEGLALSKNDIIEFCDRVLKKWHQEPAKNARNLPAMYAVRTSVLFSDETSLKAIWSEIISWVYQLLYENAQAQARKEGQEWAQIFSKLKG